MNIEVRTTLQPGGKVLQEIINCAEGLRMIPAHVIDIQEQQMHEVLRAHGWLPPKEARFLREQHDELQVWRSNFKDRGHLDTDCPAEALRTALEAVEWVEHTSYGYSYCPWCKCIELSEDHAEDHAPDCQRQAALAIVET
ncbi:MAG: hypothetical protein P1P84_02580 [Deferrisomatales bacterium]|nr:hypothetical protein [Deferrisomatales bacterium]